MFFFRFKVLFRDLLVSNRIFTFKKKMVQRLLPFESNVVHLMCSIDDIIKIQLCFDQIAFHLQECEEFRYKFVGFSGYYCCRCCSVQ